MKNYNRSLIITTGLATFSMLFGAGSMLFPLQVGIFSGSQLGVALIGFFITATLLPVLGLICSILYKGDYEAFFTRVGQKPGKFLLLLCMLIIVPLLVCSRIIAFSYEMTTPFFNHLSLFWFSVIFLLLAYICAFQEKYILSFLGKIIAPLKIGLISFIIIKGFWIKKPILAAVEDPLSTGAIFTKSLLYGYNTLDLLGTIFFGSIIYLLLKKQAPESENSKQSLYTALIGASLGAGLIATIFSGLAFLGSRFGTDLIGCNEGLAFFTVCSRVIGEKGVVLISAAVIVACFSTLLSVCVVLAQYLNETISKERISYPVSLALVMLSTLIPANLGLSALIRSSEPLLSVIYPILIMLTLCNIAYKLFNFKPVKIPVYAKDIIATIVRILF